MIALMTMWTQFIAQAGPTEPAKKPVGYGVIIVAFLILAFSFFMMRRTRKRLARGQTHQQLSARERVNERYDTSARQMHSQMGELMAELADLARQVNGQLDTRMARLEILLQQADKTLARLEAAGKQSVNGKAASNNYNMPTGNGNEDVKSTQSQWQPPRNPLLKSPFHQEVISLAQAGEKAVNIAQKLGRPVGEIELILSLHGKK